MKIREKYIQAKERYSEWKEEHPKCATAINCSKKVLGYGAVVIVSAYTAIKYQKSIDDERIEEMEMDHAYEICRKNERIEFLENLGEEKDREHLASSARSLREGSSEGGRQLAYYKQYKNNSQYLH